MSRFPAWLPAVVFLTAASPVLAQSLPTTQPNYLEIVREDVKVGHAADHAKVEAGWPAAFEKAKDPYTYIGLVSMTGTDEVWFVSPFESQAAMADSQRREDEPTLASALERLAKSDAEQISSTRSILAMARKDLSHGPYPDTAKQRFYDITVFRVRPGHEREFEAAAKAYGTAADRVAPQMSYRVYQVMAGMPSPTYLVFSSVTSYGAFDQATADDLALMKGATDQERTALEKGSADAVISSETTRFRLDPVMSYVPPSVRAQDPAFWMPKPAMAMPAKPTAKPEVKR